MKPIAASETAAFGRSQHARLGPAAIERSDTCAVTAAAVGETMVAIVLADAVLESSAAIHSAKCRTTSRLPPATLPHALCID